MPGTIGGEVATEKREGAIWKEESLLQELVEQVAEKVVQLERRLVPILRSEPPQAAGGAKEEKQAAPELVDRLNASVGGVRNIKSHLGSLLDRLEI